MAISMAKKTEKVKLLASELESSTMGPGVPLDSAVADAAGKH